MGDAHRERKAVLLATRFRRGWPSSRDTESKAPVEPVYPNCP